MTTIKPENEGVIKQRKELHKALDKLLAYYAEETGLPITDTTILELATWSNQQIDNLQRANYGRNSRPNNVLDRGSFI